MFLEIALSFAAGLAAGAVYFAGLWLTVRLFTTKRLAPPWLLLSLIVRLAVLVGAFFWIMEAGWERLLAAFGGFIAARLIATWSMRVRGGSRANGADRPQTIGAEDADHAG